MSSLRGIYTSAAKRQLQNLFANWEPARTVALGDYGVLQGDWFDRLGSVKEFGVSWTETTPPAGLSHHSFVSSDSVEVSVHGKGAAPEARAGVEVRFGKAHGVYLDAAGCSYRAIDGKRLLGEALRKVTAFDRRWAVVTDVLVAKRTIVAISSNSDARVTFEAKAEVPAFDLADGDVGLSASHRASVGYLVDAERDLTPLIGLCRFQKKFLSEGAFQSLSERGIVDVAPSDGDVSDVDFLQLR